MPEALWSQLAGVDYSAAEDRRLIWALSTPGIARGLTITAGVGRQVSVAAGAAVVDDGAGGAYIAYTTAAEVRTLPVSATTNIYIVVNPATAETTIEFGATPTNPYLTIGSAKTNATAIVSGSIVKASAKATPPAIGTNYVPLSGGVMSGALQAPRLVVSGLFGVGGADLVPNAPAGVRLGGTYPTARHYLHCSLKPVSGGSNQINNNAWEGLHWNPPSASNNVTDYTLKPMGSSDYAIWPGVAGYYLFSGHVSLNGNVSGTRSSRITVWNQNGSAADTLSYGVICWEGRPNATAGDAINLSLNAMVAMGPGQYARAEIFQNSGVALNTSGGRLLCRLLQAN